MRLEATVPDSRGSAVVELAAELGLSRSQVIDEALGLFLKVVLEVRRGRRLVMLDPNSSTWQCEIATPTLSALEWAQKPEALGLSAAALERMQSLTEDPPAPNEHLRSAARRHGR